jgi:signal transduction histidine kinase
VFRSWLKRVRPADVAVAVGFVAFALAEEHLVWMAGDWWPYTLVFFAGLVLLRRSVPLFAMLANSVAAPISAQAGGALSFRLWQLVAMTIAAYTAGQLLPVAGTDRRSRGRAALGGGLVLVTGAGYWWVDQSDPMAAIFFPVAPYLLGAVLAAQARRMAETASARASIREQQAREAVMEERVRIARELHDMVAHSVTVMVIQAGVVRRRLDAGLGVDRELLHNIESSGRDAVGELRRTLGLLRGDETDTTLPPVGLDRLDELVAQVREAGLTVSVRRDGAAPDLPPAADVSAYRIIQEALTNVLKHAGPTRVTVELRHQSDGLHLSVVNNAGSPSPPGPQPVNGGQGLIGMRERVMLFGGDLTAGPRPGGGFAVHARLPVLPAVPR